MPEDKVQKNPSDLEEAKSKVRADIKKLIKAKDEKEIHLEGVKTASILSASQTWSRYNTILAFLSLKNEIDTQPLIETALKAGKKVFLPKVKDKELIFLSIDSALGPWSSGPFGIREPISGETLKESDFPVLVITPGFAFDKCGNRLGRGGGFYDRFFAWLIAEEKQYTAIGICMDFQIIDQVPVLDIDKKVNGLLTGKGLVILK